MKNKEPTSCSEPSYINPDTGKREAVIKNTEFSSYTDFQKASYILIIVLNSIGLIMFSAMVAFVYQAMKIENTYQRFGTYTCELFYDISLSHFELLFIVIFNIVDFRMSYMIGQKLYGILVIFFNVTSFFGNTIIMLIMLFGNVLTCSANGYGGLLNMCDDPRACGALNYNNQTSNKCQFKSQNSTLLISPTLRTDQLTWNPAFTALFYMFLVIWIIGGIKMLLHLFGIPNAAKLIYKLKTQSDLLISKINSIRRKKDKIESGTMNVEKKKKKPLVKTVNIYPAMTFFGLMKTSQVWWWSIASFFDAIWFVSLIGWFGWFQPMVQSVNQGLFQTTPSNVAYLYVVNGVSYAVYALMGVNVLVSACNIFLGQIFSTEISIIGSAVGFLNNVVLEMIVVFYYMTSCNQPGSADNICNNRQKWCATYGFDAITNCRNANRYLCPVQYSVADLTGIWNYDPDFLVLFFIVTLGIIANLLVFIVGISLVLRYKTYKKPQEKYEEECEKEKKILGLISNKETVLTSDPSVVTEDDEEEEEEENDTAEDLQALISSNIDDNGTRRKQRPKVYLQHKFVSEHIASLFD